MAKKVKVVIKVQAPAGKANPAPPLGPALGQHGVAIADFCQQFNAKTADKGNLIIPAVITVYEDRSFDFVLKSPPAAVLIKNKLNLKSGSGEPHKTKVGKLSFADCVAIAKEKDGDLNSFDEQGAGMVIAGTCRSMGVEVEDMWEPNGVWTT
jgi:large subunit ribosomal protein L11